ncbi:hypothetical protein [Micromonospora costi]|nr:hypothetical protein [Micromonospora costi]
MRRVGYDLTRVVEIDAGYGLRSAPCDRMIVAVEACDIPPPQLEQR